MDLMFRHQAQPFPDRNLCSIGSSALSCQPFISKARKNLNRLRVKRIAEGHDCFIAVSQLSSATGVSTGQALNGFPEHVAFNGSDVANQISEGEFALAKRPLQFVGWDALRNPCGPLVNLVEIFQKPFDRQRLHGLEHRTLC